MAENTEIITINIMSPDKVIWEGEALALSSTNSEGPYDILPGHANFMTLASNVDIVLHLPGGAEEIFKFDQAVLFFHDDVARIYTHKPQEVNKLKNDKV